MDNRKAASDMKHELLAGKGWAFPLLPESLGNTATWCLSNMILLFLNAVNPLIVPHYEDYGNRTVPLNKMFLDLLKVEHIISYPSYPEKFLVFKLFYNTSYYIRIIYL